MDFKGKVCVISGCGSPKGIGFAIAAEFAQAGASVILTDVVDKVKTRAEELREKGWNAEAYICDLCEEADVRKMTGQIFEKYGGIDVLVNNAGWHIEGCPEEYPEFTESEKEDWSLKFNRNFITTFNMTREILPHMRKKEFGRIINIASVIGPVLGAEGDSAYAASKAGIVGMSRAIAIEVAKENITVNNVLPGYISSGSQEEAAYKAGLNTPMGRNGRPDEIAGIVAFLASEKASYITGQAIVVDGGASIEMKF